MYSTIKASLLLSLAALSAFPQSRDERWQADLDALYARILSAHPNPYTRTSPEQFASRVDSVRSAIPTYTDAQIVVEFAGIVSMLNDGHSALNLTQAGTGVRRYPLSLRWFSDGLFITAAPELQARLVGTKLISMNGRPVQAVYEAVRPWLSYDTEEWARSESQAALATHEILVAAGIVQLDGPLQLESEAPGGQIVTGEIALGATAVASGPVASRPALPLSRRVTGQDYWFEWLESERALYIQYSRCRENVLLPVRTFVEEIVSFSADHPPRLWVIDLRDNPGGNEIVFNQIFGLLESAVRSGRMPWPENGVYGIISRRTFSSGVLAAQLMKSRGAIMVGEATGGRASWFGNTPAWALPHSRLSVSISTQLIGNPATGPQVTPTEPAPFNAADFFQFRDPYLDHALRLAH